MKKSLKRALALMLACTIVIGSVYNTRQKAYASASTIIAGGGAAAVGVEVAFPYLLAITGVVAAGAAVYENRDKIKEWGSAQFGKFKKWVGDNLGELGWYADAAAAGVAIAKWGDKLGNGTLDKSDPTWSAYKKWVEDDVCTSEEYVPTYNGYPVADVDELINFSGHLLGVGFLEENENNHFMIFTYGKIGGSTKYIAVANAPCKMVNSKGVPYGEALQSRNHEGQTLYYRAGEYYSTNDGDFINYLGDGTYSKLLPIAFAALLAGGLTSDAVDSDREYTYVGGLAPSLGGAGVIEGDWDVVGVGEKEDEKETKLPWVGSPDLDHTISDVVSGEKTWTDVLDQVGVGVIDRTEEGSKVIDEDGVTTKDWVYADSTTTVPDITIPNEGEVSKELSNYTFAGLEKIFPFCLPFDMIDFIKVLDATPQAPHFKYAFPYPTTSGMKTYEIDIDLSPFDSVAELLRDMECLLFIVGLVLVTRSRMIRG